MTAAVSQVLLVHGIWDSGARLLPLRDGLMARGVRGLEMVELRPNTGAAPIEQLARQVADASVKHAGRVDIVAFSMGALTTRYFIQRLGGRDAIEPGGTSKVRRFISISGPHHGTVTAYGLPLAGVRQMRPRSALLQDLARDVDPWGTVEVHTLLTPYDVMILPARSGRLPGARSHREFPVLVHRWMLSDARVLDHVAALLTAP